MKYVFVALAIVAIALALTAEAKAPKWHALTEGYTFDKYVRDFGKGYVKGSEEWSRREALYTAQLKKVMTHNAVAKAKGLHHEGINHMSDWTSAELRRINGGIPPMGGETALRKSKPKHVHTYNGEQLPHSVDWRTATNPPVLTGIKNQGMCGDCWGHSATESMESHYSIYSGQLHVMSQQQVTSCMPDPEGCGGQGGCAGGFAELAFDYVETAGGIHQEWVYPFTSYHGDTGTCILHNNTAPVAAVKGYVAVERNNAAATMHALATKGPLSIYVDASMWSAYEGGIFKQESGCQYNMNISMDHVVQLVGYGHDFDTAEDYWIVRNSWGAAWGEAGYIRLHRPAETPCGWNTPNAMHCSGGPSKVWACGLCGLLMDPLYPLMGDYEGPPV